MLALYVKCFAAGYKQFKIRTGVKESSEIRSSNDHLLEIVQHQQQVLLM